VRYTVEIPRIIARPQGSQGRGIGAAALANRSGQGISARFPSCPNCRALADPVLNQLQWGRQLCRPLLNGPSGKSGHLGKECDSRWSAGLMAALSPSEGVAVRVPAVVCCTACSISSQLSKRLPLSASEHRIFHQGSIRFRKAV